MEDKTLASPTWSFGVMEGPQARVDDRQEEEEQVQWQGLPGLGVRQGSKLGLLLGRKKKNRYNRQALPGIRIRRGSKVGVTDGWKKKRNRCSRQALPGLGVNWGLQQGLMIRTQVQLASPTWSWGSGGAPGRGHCWATRRRSDSPTWSWGQAGLQVGVIDGETLPSFQEGVVVQPRGLFRVYMLTQLPQLLIREVGLQNSPPCVGRPPCTGP